MSQTIICTRTPYLNFAKIIAKVIFIYLGFLCIFVFGAGMFFPDYVKGSFDMSIDTFYHMALIVLSFLGVAVGLIILIGGWCIMFFKSSNSNAHGA